MREIKFRAWDKNKKRMLPVTLMDFSEWWISCAYQEDLHYGERNSFKNEETDRHILMQYTGLKDKNGVEIYEGDVVKFSYISPLDSNEKSYVWVVEYENGMYWLRHIGAKKYYDNSLYLKFTQIAVIGNIYEHPHLLEDKA